MFDWLTKRLARRMLARMLGLAQVAQTATYAVLEHDLGRPEPASEAERSVLGMKAAARCNFLFASGPNEAHVRQLDLATEHAAALEWLRGHSFYQELVVQSLRVLHLVQFGRNEFSTAPLSGEQILLEFGLQFPNAPDPKSFRALVLRAVRELPPEDQRAIGFK